MRISTGARLLIAYRFGKNSHPVAALGSIFERVLDEVLQGVPESQGVGEHRGKLRLQCARPDDELLALPGRGTAATRSARR